MRMPPARLLATADRAALPLLVEFAAMTVPAAAIESGVSPIFMRNTVGEEASPAAEAWIYTGVDGVGGSADASLCMVFADTAAGGGGNKSTLLIRAGRLLLPLPRLEFISTTACVREAEAILAVALLRLLLLLPGLNLSAPRASGEAVGVGRRRQ